jgi:hypothetical protein
LKELHEHDSHSHDAVTGCKTYALVGVLQCSLGLMALGEGGTRGARGSTSRRISSP